jgi:DNA-binding HxlR family transcriptional regulator
VTQRSYGQFCAAAKALDVVGERWTLLLIRELLLGPRRFTDLLYALPGLGTSLLTSRLKHLEAAGVIRREQLPPPAGSWVYQITETGLGVGLVVKALADWGAQLLDTPAPEEAFRAEWIALYLAASAPAGALPGAQEIYQVHVDDDVLYIVLTPGGAYARPGLAPQSPDLVIRTDQATFIELGLGRADLTALAAAGRAQVTGDQDRVARAARLFSSAGHRPELATRPPG